MRRFSMLIKSRLTRGFPSGEPQEPAAKPVEFNRQKSYSLTAPAEDVTLQNDLDTARRLFANLKTEDARSTQLATIRSLEFRHAQALAARRKSTR